MLIEQRLKVSQSANAPTIRPTQIIYHSLGDGYHFDAGVEWLRGDNNPLEAHYAIRADGLIVQITPETKRAEANYTANLRPDGTGAISIETDSSVEASEKWTAEQVQSLIELSIAICRRHGIPGVQCTSPSAPGLGWHIMWGSPGAWTPSSKVCPGAARIEQVRIVIIPAVAAALAGGRGDYKPPIPKPDIPVDTGDWLDMTIDEPLLRKIISEQVNKVLESDGVIGAGDLGRLEPNIRKWVSEEVTKVSESQGFAGAADFGRLQAQLIPALVAAFADHGVPADQVLIIVAKAFDTASAAVPAMAAASNRKANT